MSSFLRILVSLTPRSVFTLPSDACNSHGNWAASCATQLRKLPVAMAQSLAFCSTNNRKRLLTGMFPSSLAISPTSSVPSKSTRLMKLSIKGMSPRTVCWVSASISSRTLKCRAMHGSVSHSVSVPSRSKMNFIELISSRTRASADQGSRARKNFELQYSRP